MSELNYIKLKNCACCLKLLDTVPKRGIRRVNISDSLDNLNTVSFILYYFNIYKLLKLTDKIIIFAYFMVKLCANVVVKITL